MLVAARFALGIYQGATAAGVISLGCGQLVFAQLSAPGSYEVHLLPGLLLTAVALGLLFPLVAVLATVAAAPGDRGLAGGLLAAAQQVGMAVGPTVLATVAAARARSAPGPRVMVAAEPVQCPLAGRARLRPGRARLRNRRAARPGLSAAA